MIKLFSSDITINTIYKINIIKLIALIDIKKTLFLKIDFKCLNIFENFFNSKDIDIICIKKKN